MIYYLPGCTTAALHPEAAARLKAYIMRNGMPEAPCCKEDVSILQEGDTVITCCTNCDLMFAERTPYIKVVSVYEYLLGDPDFPWPDLDGAEMTLQDCWRERDNRVIQDAVRECLKRMNVSVVELPDNREKSSYCGVWLNNPIIPANLKYAPKTFGEIQDKYLELLSPDEQKAKMEAYAKNWPTQEVVIYCNGCERGVRLTDKTPRHMVELLASGLV